MPSHSEKSKQQGQFITKPESEVLSQSGRQPLISDFKNYSSRYDGELLKNENDKVVGCQSNVTDSHGETGSLHNRNVSTKQDRLKTGLQWGK